MSNRFRTTSLLGMNEGPCKCKSNGTTRMKKTTMTTPPVAVAKTKTTTSRRKVPKRTRKVYGYDDNDGPQQRYGSEKMAVPVGQSRTMNREVPGDRHFLQWDELDSNGFLLDFSLGLGLGRPEMDRDLRNTYSMRKSQMHR